MANGPRDTTQYFGSLNLKTPENGGVPEFLINGVPIGDGADYKVQSSGLIIDTSTDLYLSSTTQTLTMPTVSLSPVTIKSVSGIATLDGGTNTFENGATVTSPAASTLYLDGTVWRDV